MVVGAFPDLDVTVRRGALLLDAPCMQGGVDGVLVSLHDVNLLAALFLLAPRESAHVVCVAIIAPSPVLETCILVHGSEVHGRVAPALHSLDVGCEAESLPEELQVRVIAWIVLPRCALLPEVHSGLVMNFDPCRIARDLDMPWHSGSIVSVRPVHLPALRDELHIMVATDLQLAQACVALLAALGQLGGGSSEGSLLPLQAQPSEVDSRRRP
mmetsp:Transcript_63936/g.177363  ORF Transcript_63936/g.177363 Transcript_63936/m.177363 type:complete len:213 (+) Transcript_63936:265-903(+)